MSLAIVPARCLIALRAGWNGGNPPSLESQGNWVWLVTAAPGGKAVQKFAVVQAKKTTIGERWPNLHRRQRRT
jgi:hypothetical protein